MHEVNAVQLHHQMSEVIAARSLTHNQSLFRRRRLEHTRFVGADVAIPLQLRTGNVAHLYLHLQLTVLQVVADKLPDGALFLVQGQHMHTHDAVAHIVPTVVTQQIRAHAILIIRLAIVDFIQGYSLNLETHALIVAFLRDGEDRAVACLDAVIGIAAIKCPCEAVVAVLRYESCALRIVLKSAQRVTTAVVIRLQRSRNALPLNVRERKQTEQRRH